MLSRAFFDEFFHRKSDGIGMSEKYPQIADALTLLYDLLPEKLTGISDEDAARLTGMVAQKGAKATDALAKIATSGPVLFLAETVVDKALKSKTKSDVAGIAAKEIIKPGAGADGAIKDKMKDYGFNLVGLVVTLGAYNLIQAGNEYLREKDAAWHAKTGKKMLEGSDLAKEWGNFRNTVTSATLKANLQKQISGDYNRDGAADNTLTGPWKSAPIIPQSGRVLTDAERTRLARYNPFISAPKTSRVSDPDMEARKARMNPFAPQPEKQPKINAEDQKRLDNMAEMNPFIARLQLTGNDDLVADTERDSPFSDPLSGPRPR
jgi:hypothetical protein